MTNRHLYIYRSGEDKIAFEEGAQPNISQKMIRETEITIPPLPEQRHIVAYLDALQAKVDAFRRLRAETGAELDALLPAVLDKAFKGEM